MGLYIRKSFRMGPLRLNLSRSGLGVSAGVKGARIGYDARGRAYVHAGRGGVYYREYLGSGTHAASRDAPASGLAAPPADPPGDGADVIYQATKVAYRPAVALPPHPAPLSVPAVRPDVRLVLGMVACGVGIIALFLGAAGLVAGGALLLAGGLSALVGRRADLAAERLRGALARAVSAGPDARDAWAEADAQLRAGGVWRDTRRLEVERAFLEACRAAVADGRVTADECGVLDRLESAIGGPTERTIDARVDAFLAIYFKAVADRTLSEEEESTLAHIRRVLHVRDITAKPYMEWMRELRVLREIEQGTPPEVEPTLPLPAGEVCYFEAPGRLLEEKQLRTFQRDHVRYHMRGLVVEQEGTLLITDKHILLVHDGTTSIPLTHVVHVEIDADANLLRITRDDRVNPVILTTPDVLRAGALVERAVGEGR